MSLPLHHSGPAGRSSNTWATWRVTRGLLAAAGLVAVLAGVPWALLQFTEWPITGLPTWEQITDFPAVATEDSTIVAMATVGIWIAWAVFVVCVVIEAISEIRGTAAARVPAAGPLQHLARTLVASVAMTIGSLSSLSSLAAPGTAGTSRALVQATAATATASPAVQPDAATGHDTPDHAETTGPPSDPTEDETHVQWETVVVEHGDSAWSLAEYHYGDGTEWLRLWRDNKNELQPDGRTWANQTDPITPGWVLRIRTNTAAATPGHHPTASAAGIQTIKATPVAASAPAPASPPPVERNQVTVQPGDNFWRLAEAQLEANLGRPAAPTEVVPYWHAVIAANRDRLTQPDNPDRIYPGQTFILPPIPTAAAPAAPASTTSPPAPTPTASQETTSPTVPQPTDESIPTTSTHTDSTTSPTTTAPPRRPPNGAEPADTDHGSDQPPAHRRAADDGGDGSATVAVLGTLTAGLALAVGVTRAIWRRRRRRNHLHPTSAPRPSSNPRLHRDLIVAADEDAHGELRRALHDLATVLAAAGATSRPRVVQHGPDHLDVLLDTPTLAAADGWKVQGDDGAIWSWQPNGAELSGPDDQDLATTPLLVTVGEPDAGGQLYLDLEAEGTISLTGDPAVARGVARAMITELAHSPLAGATQLIVIGGLATPSIAALDNTTVADDWESVADSVHAWTEQSRDALAHNGWPNAFAARSQHAQHDALIPLVVVTDEPPDADDLADLQATQPRATALVVVGQEVDQATVIDCTPGRLALLDLGLVCTPQTLDDDHVDAIVDLLDDAENPAGEQLELLTDIGTTAADEQPDLDHADGAAPVTGNGGPYQDPPYDVLVRLLGDITVDGAKRLTPKQTSVLAYIALHRTATAERAGDAIWPEQATSWRRQLSNTVSACRSVIGGQHLAHSNDGTYRAGPRLLTDTELFTRRLAAAASQPRAQAIETLHGALDLVRGPIFHYPDKQKSPWAWVSLEDWISLWEPKITTVTGQVADAYLDAGEPQPAVDIAQRIHAIVPHDTELTELLMRCHAANGDRVAVRRAYHTHIDALTRLDVDDPAESTVALYEQLRNATTA